MVFLHCHSIAQILSGFYVIVAVQAYRPSSPPSVVSRVVNFAKPPFYQFRSVTSVDGRICYRRILVAMASPTTSVDLNAMIIPSWAYLMQQVSETPVGRALNNENEIRNQGRGSAHVQNKLRLFDSSIASPQARPSVALFRDHAGWCPYCQKTMLLVEEKRIPVQIELINMRSYGDKPAEFLRKVPNGLLPAIEVNGRVITESQVIMELLDKWHSAEDGYKPMMPSNEAGLSRYGRLARLERELFSWWCTLVFRPEGPKMGSGGGGNPLSSLLRGGTNTAPMSAAMKGFLDCMGMVDKELQTSKGPWFFDEYDYPTMIDFIYVSHVERMLASCAYWKGLNLRDAKWNFNGLNAWLEAFEKREPYLAFKSDYYTHVMDIPPQYGPGWDGGFDDERERFSRTILGRDGSWHLPLPTDDPLQPLYHGPPLPLCVLDVAGIAPNSNGSYYSSANTPAMAHACRVMAAWKLSGNGSNVSKFAARGGPAGAKNPRKSFGAPLADPYANPDSNVQSQVEAALQVICHALLELDDEMPSSLRASQLRSAAMPHVDGVVSSLTYLRDRVGVPRDLPLAAARYLRAYLNWGIDTLSSGTS